MEKVTRTVNSERREEEDRGKESEEDRVSTAENKGKEVYDGKEEREEESVVEVESEAREDITGSEVQNTGEGGNHKKDNRAEGPVEEVTERNEGVRTPHGVEKEKTGGNEDRTE